MNALTCDIPEHTHGADCYDAEGNLVCTQAEHTHCATCLTQQRVLTCDKGAGHVHNDECYTQMQILQCELAEHTHGEECYDAEGNLTCTQQEHTHTEVCYTTERVLTCTQSESEQPQAHVHTDACYKLELTCGKQEHTHSDNCYADRNADVENADDWEATLPEEEELNGEWPHDVVAVAESQLDYTESVANWQLSEDGQSRQGYTRYGAWFGSPYADWCAMFASFCLHYAGVPKEAISYNASCPGWVEELKQAKLFVSPDADYIPQPGDLLFLNFDPANQEEIDEEETGEVAAERMAQHVAIVKEFDEAHQVLYAYEGNSNNKVQVMAYFLPGYVESTGAEQQGLPEEESFHTSGTSMQLHEKSIVGYGSIELAKAEFDAKYPNGLNPDEDETSNELPTDNAVSNDITDVDVNNVVNDNVNAVADDAADNSVYARATTSVSLKKVVAGANAGTDKGSQFLILMWTYCPMNNDNDWSKWNILSESYSATIRDANNTIQNIPPVSYNSVVTLKSGETLTIDGLPVGARIAFYEENYDGNTLWNCTGSMKNRADGPLSHTNYWKGWLKQLEFSANDNAFTCTNYIPADLVVGTKVYGKNIWTSNCLGDVFTFQICDGSYARNNSDMLSHPHIGAGVAYDIYTKTSGTDTNGIDGSDARYTKTGTGTTGANGVFTLKCDQKAVFHDILPGTVRVVERIRRDTNPYAVHMKGDGEVTVTNDTFGTETYGFTIDGEDCYVSNAFSINAGGRYEDGTASETKVRNAIIDSGVTIYMPDTDTDVHWMIVTIDGVLLPTNVAIYRKNGTEYYKMTEPGLVPVDPGSSTTIWNLRRGQTFEVTEKAEGYVPTYTVNGAKQLGGSATGVIGLDVANQNQTPDTNKVQVTKAEQGITLDIPVKKIVSHPDGTSRNYKFSIYCWGKDNECETPSTAVNKVYTTVSAINEATGSFKMKYLSKDFKNGTTRLSNRIDELALDDRGVIYETGIRYDVFVDVTKQADGTMSAQLISYTRELNDTGNRHDSHSSRAAELNIAEFNNTLIPNSVSLTNKVSGQGAETNREFEFQLMVWRGGSDGRQWEQQSGTYGYRLYSEDASGKREYYKLTDGAGNYTSIGTDNSQQSINLQYTSSGDKVNSQIIKIKHNWTFVLYDLADGARVGFYKRPTPRYAASWDCTTKSGFRPDTVKRYIGYGVLFDIAPNPSDDISINHVTRTSATGTEIPQTGGVGEDLFYGIGALLMCCAGYLLLRRKRRDVTA